MNNRQKKNEDCKAALLGFVSDLKQSYGYERSFKITEGCIYQQRFLISLHLDALDGLALSRLQALALALNMPKKLMDVLPEELSVVDIIHFGFEQQQSSTVCKFYFEQPFSEGSNLRQLIHRAFKWDVFSPEKNVVAEYFFLPGLSREEMISRIVSSCGVELNHPITGFVKQLLDLGGMNLPVDEIFFLEVEEEGNPRRSFDIKLYDSDLTVGQAGPVIESAAKYFNVPIDTVKALIKLEFDQELGHLSGGIGRDAKEFVSFYFGVEFK